ncbi:MAG: RNA polymerase sigma factor [Prevotellaceae bacterium]|jgi:RNA polymerase sigma factor (sigma-70 family)|nr:RNA polymerase sigma factor [Prevotellaceae bacterium]
MEKNEKKTVETLVAEYQPQLKAFIRKRVSNKQDADDILQEVFYQLAKADSLLKPIEQVSAWLYKVARNQIINHRKKKREYELPIFDSDEETDIMEEFSKILFDNSDLSDSPEMEYLKSLVWKELEDALLELPVEQCEVFEQTELLGFSLKEVSQRTGVSVNTLLSRKHYAVVHLRKRLKELYYDIIET